MKDKGMWAMLIAPAIIVSLVLVSSPVIACFGQTTSCEGDSCYQGDGGATDYWYNDLYPPEHEVNPGETTTWIINVQGGGGCSDYEHCTVTDNTPPSGWTTTIKMGTIYTGSFTYVSGGTVLEGDDIEGKEIYIGHSWNFDIIYNVTAPPDAIGGQRAEMICTVYLVGYLPENQHDYVFVHCTAKVIGPKPPSIWVLSPNGGEILNGTANITWGAFASSGKPLEFDIFLSSDGGSTYPYTLVTGLGDAVRYWLWDTTPYPDGLNYRIKIVTFDSVCYEQDISDDVFALDNYAPDPPSNLVIHLGLTTNALPSAKAIDDDTGSDLERIQENDTRGYQVSKGMTLSMETFNTITQNDPVESAMLYVKYWVNDTGYSGNNSVMWKLETDAIWSNTGIKPLDTEICSVLKSFDLYANGVDTIDKLANLDIQFMNDDGGSAQSVNFDYMWITFKASSNDLGLTWLPSPSPDIDHYVIYRSPDNSAYSWAGETSNTAWNDPGTAVDLDRYFYRVHAVDTGGKEGIPTYVVAKYVSSLSNGRNLVSTPLVSQGDTSLGTVLQSIDGVYDNVWNYRSGNSKPWAHWQESKPSALNSLSDMDNMNGYYINVGSSDHLITIGRLPGGEIIPLKAGWNLIGYPSLDSELRDTALSSISGKYDYVYRFDPVSGREVKATPSEYMEPGNGYWIFANQNCNLIM